MRDTYDPDAVMILRAGAPKWNQFRQDKMMGRAVNLVGADLRGTDLNHADLRNMNLAGADLSHTSLAHADFRGANLCGALLQSAACRGTRFDGADLSNANLKHFIAKVPHHLSEHVSASFRDATLRHAQLQQAEFDRAVLDGADLQRANLDGATFYSVTISRVNFAGATFSETRIVATDVSTALGLDNILHAGPSHLDLETLRRSQGKLPARFLQGCGLTDLEISMSRFLDPSLSDDIAIDLLYRMVDLRSMQPVQIQPIFISYSHHDKEFIETLTRRMHRAGVRFWLDQHELRAGRIERQIDRAIRLNPVVVLVLSQHSVGSDWVEAEAAMARELERHINRDVLCPIALDDAWKNSDWPVVLRRQIEKYHILDFSEWKVLDVFERQWQRLVEGLGLFYRL